MFYKLDRKTYKLGEYLNITENKKFTHFAAKIVIFRVQ